MRHNNVYRFVSTEPISFKKDTVQNERRNQYKLDDRRSSREWC